MERELRKRHFVADLIFYQEQDEGDPELCERIAMHNLDILFWMSPKAAAQQTLLRMMDGGVSVVVVNDGKGSFPRSQYLLDPARAIREAMQEWKEAGVKRVQVWFSAEKWDEHILHLHRRVLNQLGISWDMVEAVDKDVPELIRKLARKPDVGVTIISHRWYDRLCHLYTDDFRKLLASRRVLLPQGPLYHPAYQGETVIADTIVMDHERMAIRIAEDIASQRTESGDLLATFHTRYEARMNLGSVRLDY